MSTLYLSAVVRVRTVKVVVSYSTKEREVIHTAIWLKI
jgi:hypothetical protein